MKPGAYYREEDDIWSLCDECYENLDRYIPFWEELNYDHPCCDICGAELFDETREA